MIVHSLPSIKKILLGPLLLSLLGGCFLLPKEEKVLEPPVLLQPTDQVYETAVVQKGPIQNIVTGTATFVPKITVDHFFVDTGGRIQHIYVQLGDEVNKGDLLAELYTGQLENQIKLQELNVRRMKLSLDYKQVTEATKFDLELAQIDLEAEQLKLDNLLRQLESSRLYASLPGVIVFLNSRLVPGENIAAFQTLATVADKSQLELKYTGSRIFDFVPGASVGVEVHDYELTGTVVESPSNMPSDADEAQRRTVTIDVPKLPPGVDSGDQGKITLILDSRDDALISPVDAVRDYMGRKYVYILQDELRQERTVETGIETATEIEIVKGLNEGDLVILR